LKKITRVKDRDDKLSRKSHSHSTQKQKQK
jgi:hypothetical protein